MDAAAMGLSAIYLRILRSACARAEPVVSACVLVKSLKMHSYMADRPLAAAVYWFASERKQNNVFFVTLCAMGY